MIFFLFFFFFFSSSQCYLRIIIYWLDKEYRSLESYAGESSSFLNWSQQELQISPFINLKLHFKTIFLIEKITCQWRLIEYH